MAGTPFAVTTKFSALEAGEENVGRRRAEDGDRREEQQRREIFGQRTRRPQQDGDGGKPARMNLPCGRDFGHCKRAEG
jgi:hypothetical protein